MTTPPIGNSISRSPLPRRSPGTVGRKWARRAIVPRRRDEGGSLLTVLLLALCCFALSPAPKAFGVTPAPDGGYPGANTAEGQTALQSLTTGTNNTAFGFQALYHDTTGSNNAATGFRALYINTSGVNNTGTGSQALFSNTTGNQNTATGYVALSSNTSGASNTATGSGALHGNTTASHNTATGYISLYKNTTGTFNTATGDRALYSNSTASHNTADGYAALNDNTTGFNNTAAGFQALNSNINGNSNTANGGGALGFNTTGNDNTAIGIEALFYNTSGSYNVALGPYAGYSLNTGSYNVCIGAAVFGVSGESNTTRISNIYSSVASDRAVYVNSDNKIGTLASSRRYKDEIKPMNKASETILALKPVTFRYKQELDPHHTPMFGLIAEEVEKVNPDLVSRNDKGEAETVRYDAVNAMLLNEFLKEHRKMQKLEATIAKQQKQIEALTTGLQKVSAQLELSKPAPQVAGNQP